MFIRLLGMGSRWRIWRGKSVSLEAETVHASVTRDKHGSVSGVRVTVDTPNRFRFALRPETSLDRLGKRLGVVREWQTGDDAFDSGTFIASEDWALLEAMSADRDLRSAISELLRLHAGASLECANGRLSFACQPAGVDRNASDELLREQFARQIHPALSKLRERLARIVVGDWDADRDPALRRRAILGGITLVLGVTGLIGALVGSSLDRFQVVRAAISYFGWYATAAIGGAMLLAVILWFRRTPHTHSVLLDVLLVALPGAWLTADASLTWYNQKYDAAAVVRWPVIVESVHTSRHKGTTSYHLRLDLWPDSRGDRNVKLREEEYRVLGPGKCVIAKWHPGRLGDGWISGFVPASETDCDRGAR